MKLLFTCLFVALLSISIASPNPGDRRPVDGFVIHPSADNSVCVGILGGNYVNGAPVDVYECNGSNTQRWQFSGGGLVSVDPASGSQFCLDAGLPSQWTNGQKMKIWQCIPGLPQQGWIRGPGIIRLSFTNYCLDLPNGNTTNQNILQIWDCTPGDYNQFWIPAGN